MKKIIRKILKEDRKQMFLNKILQVMKNDFPFFRNLKEYGLYGHLSKDEIIYVFSEIFGQPVTINKMSYGFIIYDENGDRVYFENFDGNWSKYEYDDRGNQIYYEDSYGNIKDYR